MDGKTKNKKFKFKYCLDIQFYIDLFQIISMKCSEIIGHPLTFILATLSVIVWYALGPYYNYSDTWQLVINTSTTIITFLIVFLIQNTQNRDMKTLQIKIDELIKAFPPARNSVINLDSLSDKQLKQLEAHYKELSED